MQPILGTALWGWTIEKKQCFALLDAFYQAGHRHVDTATNYPIDKNPSHFRWAENTILEWIKAHGIRDLAVMTKVGSINNMGTPDNNLSKSFLLINIDDYLFRFEENLHTFMLHWDNRNNEEEIAQTLEALSVAQKQGLTIGLSGIKHPDIYAQLNKAIGLKFRIQIKHNILQSAYAHYAPLHGQHDFLAYGINAGGIKLNADEYHQQSSYSARGGDTNTLPPKAQALLSLMQTYQKNGASLPFSNFNECGLIYASQQKDIKGVLLGTSRLEQLEASLAFIAQIQSRDYSVLYQELQQIANGEI